MRNSRQGGVLACPVQKGVSHTGETCCQASLCLWLISKQIPNHHLWPCQANGTHICHCWWVCNDPWAVPSACVWSENPLSFSAVQKWNEKQTWLLRDHVVHFRVKCEWLCHFSSSTLAQLSLLNSQELVILKPCALPTCSTVYLHFLNVSSCTVLGV